MKKKILIEKVKKEKTLIQVFQTYSRSPEMLALLIYPLLMLNWRISQRKRNRDSLCSANIPSRVKEEVRKYAYRCGTEPAINRLKPKYPQYTFVRITINSWKRNFDNQKEIVSSPKFN